jgi:two-component system, chemotaxis family, response regulator Rcp1
MADRVLLCVEDSDADYYLIKMAVRETGRAIEMCRASDGEQALAFLRRSKGYETSPWPDLILLDLNLPRKNGLEVLFDFQASDTFRSIPVIMFSSSRIATDKNAALDLGAKGYIPKPATLDGLLIVVSSVCGQYLGPEL